MVPRATMKKIMALWETYLASGSRHFHTPTEQKLNRVLNLLFSLNFLANTFLIIVELIVFAMLLKHDSQKYLPYFIPFATANTFFALAILAVIYLKNKTGSFRTTYLSTFFYTAYCVLLAIFLGDGIQGIGNSLTGDSAKNVFGSQIGQCQTDGGKDKIQYRKVILDKFCLNKPLDFISDILDQYSTQPADKANHDANQKHELPFRYILDTPDQEFF